MLLHSISSLRLEWQSMAWWVWYGITNIIVEGALGAANQLYLETHGYRRDDGEAPDLFAMNVQGMRGTSTGMRETNRAEEEPTCIKLPHPTSPCQTIVPG